MMKKLYIFFLFFLILNTALSQDNTFPNSGNVGIGTTTPMSKLDVNGSISWKGYNSGDPRALKIGYSGGNYGGIGYNIDFTSSNGIFNRPIQDFSSYLEFDHGGFKFFGTGGTSPAQGINLNGGENNLGLLAMITKAGNFGIGTDNPLSKLHVYQIVPDQAGLIVQGNTINSDNAQHYIAITLDGDYGNGAGNYSQIRSYSNLYNYWGSRLAFFTTSSTAANTLLERMRIDSNGDVGIGTEDPKGYKLAVNGKIRVHEIKVETANWPDYVFAKDHKLTSLKNTEKHIKEKGHLPGIPSAVEVKANGIDLGEMNAKLLQKIEELTLHLIQQNKLIETYGKQLISQNERIIKLEAKKLIK
jgi:hypothetical protein